MNERGCNTRTSLSLYTHHRAKAVYEAVINLSVYVRTVLKLKEAASCNQRCSRRATFTDDRAYEEPDRIYKYESILAKSVIAHQSSFLILKLLSFNKNNYYIELHYFFA